MFQRTSCMLIFLIVVLAGYGNSQSTQGPESKDVGSGKALSNFLYGPLVSERAFLFASIETDNFDIFLCHEDADNPGAAVIKPLADGANSERFPHASFNYTSNSYQFCYITEDPATGDYINLHWKDIAPLAPTCDFGGFIDTKQPESPEDPPIIRELDLTLSEPSLSPDGKRILAIFRGSIPLEPCGDWFSYEQGVIEFPKSETPLEFYSTDVRWFVPQNIAPTMETLRNPCWSPDQSYIAFANRERCFPQGGSPSFADDRVYCMSLAVFPNAPIDIAQFEVSLLNANSKRIHDLKFLPKLTYEENRYDLAILNTPLDGAIPPAMLPNETQFTFERFNASTYGSEHTISKKGPPSDIHFLENSLTFDVPAMYPHIDFSPDPQGETTTVFQALLGFSDSTCGDRLNLYTKWHDDYWHTSETETLMSNVDPYSLSFVEHYYIINTQQIVENGGFDYVPRVDLVQDFVTPDLASKALGVNSLPSVNESDLLWKRFTSAYKTDDLMWSRYLPGVNFPPEELDELSPPSHPTYIDNFDFFNSPVTTANGIVVVTSATYPGLMEEDGLAVLFFDPLQGRLFQRAIFTFQNQSYANAQLFALRDGSVVLYHPLVTESLFVFFSPWGEVLHSHQLPFTLAGDCNNEYSNITLVDREIDPIGGGEGDYLPNDHLYCLTTDGAEWKFKLTEIEFLRSDAYKPVNGVLIKNENSIPNGDGNPWGLKRKTPYQKTAVCRGALDGEECVFTSTAIKKNGDWHYQIHAVRMSDFEFITLDDPNSPNLKAWADYDSEADGYNTYLHFSSPVYMSMNGSDYVFIAMEIEPEPRADHVYWMQRFKHDSSNTVLYGEPVDEKPSDPDMRPVIESTEYFVSLPIIEHISSQVFTIVSAEGHDDTHFRFFMQTVDPVNLDEPIQIAPSWAPDVGDWARPFARNLVSANGTVFVGSRQNLQIPHPSVYSCTYNPTPINVDSAIPWWQYQDYIGSPAVLPASYCKPFMCSLGYTNTTELKSTVYWMASFREGVISNMPERLVGFRNLGL